MPTEIKIPAVGESITEVTIAKWLKPDGAAVKRDEVIAELESDKATFELPAEADGILKIRVAEGETINIGTVIAELEGAAAGNGQAAPAPAPTPPAAADPLSKGEENAQASDQAGYGGTPADRPDSSPATPGAADAAPTASGGSAGGGTVEMKIPAVGESITEVTVAKWLKPDGAQVARDEVIAELESDKATFELPAEAAGTLRHAVQEGETISIGATIARIEGG